MVALTGFACLVRSAAGIHWSSAITTGGWTATLNVSWSTIVHPHLSSGAGGAGASGDPPRIWRANFCESHRPFRFRRLRLRLR